MLEFNLHQIWNRLGDFIAFGALFSYLILAILSGYCIYKYYLKAEELRERTVAIFQRAFYFCVLPLVTLYACMPHFSRNTDDTNVFALSFYVFWRRLDTILSINLLVSAVIFFLILGFGAYRYYVKKATIRSGALIFFRKVCFFYLIPLMLLVLLLPRAIK